MKLNRENIAMTVGALACLLASTQAIVEVPSAKDSFIATDETVQFVNHSVGFATGLGAAIMVFGFATLAMLLISRRAAVRLRYIAVTLLLALLTLPQILLIMRPEVMLDAHLVYLSADMVVEDMEANFNLQQVGWRASQTFNLAFVSSLQLQAASPVRLGDLSWESVHLIVANNLGMQNSILNQFRAGFYLSLAGLVCWLMGAYSSDPEAARRRTLDRRWLPLLAVMVIGAPQALRLDSAADGQAARQLAGAGDYAQAVDATKRSLRWMRGSEYSLSFHEVAGKRAQNLMCRDCDAAITERIRFAMETEGDFEKAGLLLTAYRPELRSQPGYRYWVSRNRTLIGIHKFNQGQVSAADVEFRRALEAVPLLALAWYGRALVQNRLGDHARAAHYLENALRIQKQLNFQRLTLEAQFYLMHAWDAFRSGNLILAHEFYTLYLSPESWE